VEIEGEGFNMNREDQKMQKIDYTAMSHAELVAELERSQKRLKAVENLSRKHRRTLRKGRKALTPKARTSR
jgi:hypothetical protein